MASNREERIRHLAHEIWVREGRPHGRDAAHWRLAEEAYDAEMSSTREGETGGTRLDDAGASIGQDLMSSTRDGAADDPGEDLDSEDDDEGDEAPREWTMSLPAASPPPAATSTVATPGGAASSQPVAPRKRRTKAEMEAARAAEAAASASSGRGRRAKVAEAMPATSSPPRKRGAKADKATAAVAVGAIVAGAAAVAATVAATKRKRGAKAGAAGDAPAAESTSPPGAQSEPAVEGGPVPEARTGIDATVLKDAPRRGRKSQEGGPRKRAAGAQSEPAAEGTPDAPRRGRKPRAGGAGQVSAVDVLAFGGVPAATSGTTPGSDAPHEGTPPDTPTQDKAEG